MFNPVTIIGMSTQSSDKSPLRRELVLGQLMEAAERLFAQKGVAGTSLQELADAIGLTRTAVYHYVSGKDEMLKALVEGFSLEAAEDLETLSKARGSTAIRRLHQGVSNMALRVARNPQRFRVLLTAEGALPDALAKQYRSARRRTLAAMAALVRQSIAEGHCKPVDATMASFVLLGACNWVAFWYPRAEGSSAPEEIADSIATMALGGLLVERTPPDTGSIDHVFGLLREDLARLEVMIRDRGAVSPRVSRSGHRKRAKS